MKLLELRKKNHLTQKDVAKVLGVSSRTYANYENEFTQPDINLLIELSDFYNVSVDYLIGKTEITQLKKIRQEKGYSQEEIAKKINISQSNYSKYELGKIEPNIELLIKLADIFNVSIDYLLGHQIYNKPAGEFYQLTDKQKELIPYIKNLDDGTCMRVLGYLDKISQEQEELNKRIN